MKTRDKYKVIEELSAKYPIYRLCALSKVSKSGYYKWKNRKIILSNKDIEDLRIKEVLLEAHKKYRGIYGKLRLCAYANLKLNIKINHKRIYRLMKELGIKSVIRKKKYLRKYIPGKSVDNNLKRKFKASEPLEKICMDITYIPLGQKKFLFMNAAKDLYNNEIIACDLSLRNSIKLVQNTIYKILKMPLKKECIIHTDQGFQYTRKEYCDILKMHNVKQSMSRKGNCWDNAPIESFFSHFKSELIYLLKEGIPIEVLKREIHKYMEFYNEERIQLKLKGLSPIEYRKQAF
ncbi:MULTISPECIES: IS3 family transposase [Psychrilyobacter]|uniref:IS3 family transposase n=1 Tax=Psychrilyobacter TaxID=623282 RepID=UPI0013144140|nr:MULTISPECIES: IS3 family transposase [Psychrilyobacter]MCS5422427.1 IS3 family transposase [Psychrilyobacter sp. S5]NDI79059.1 IS3 family transposase [Psychrilyobacter piezotolerans]